MKLLKVLGGIVAALGIAVAVFWFGWLSIPDAEETCAHLSTLLHQEGGPEQLPESIQAVCVEYVNTPSLIKGRLRHVEDIKCMNDASDLDTVASQCDGRVLVRALRAVNTPAGRELAREQAARR